MKRRIVKYWTAMLLTGLYCSLAAPLHAEDGNPFLVASIGDSITTAFDAKWILNNRPLNWATGYDKKGRVKSHYSRLVDALGSQRAVTYANYAVPGAQIDQVKNQITKLLKDHPKVDYLTLAVGGNDVCSWPKSDHQESLRDYADGIRSIIAKAHDANPNIKIVLSPVPDLNRLYDVGVAKHCSFKWKLFPICTDLLRSKTQEQRDAFRIRVTNANAALAQIARENAGVVTFNDAMGTYQFEPEHLSGIDCFHPSVAGQQLISDLNWSDDNLMF